MTYFSEKSATFYNQNIDIPWNNLLIQFHDAIPHHDANYSSFIISKGWDDRWEITFVSTEQTQIRSEDDDSPCYLGIRMIGEATTSALENLFKNSLSDEEMVWIKLSGSYEGVYGITYPRENTQ
jgi:hypothetical protein